MRGHFRPSHDALKQVDDADLVIIDTPGRLSAETFEVARASDLIVLPTGTSSDDLHPTTLLLYELEQIGIPKDRLCVALCRILDAKEERWARHYLETTGYRALSGSLPERLGYRRAPQSRQVGHGDERKFAQRTRQRIDGERAEKDFAARAEGQRRLLGALRSGAQRNWWCREGTE